MTQCPRCGDCDDSDMTFRHSRHLNQEVCSQCYFELTREGKEDGNPEQEATGFDQILRRVTHGTSGAIHCRKCGEGYWHNNWYKGKYVTCNACGGVVCKESAEAIKKQAKFMPHPITGDMILDIHQVLISVSRDGNFIQWENDKEYGHIEV